MNLRPTPVGKIPGCLPLQGGSLCYGEQCGTRLNADLLIDNLCSETAWSTMPPGSLASAVYRPLLLPFSPRLGENPTIRRTITTNHRNSAYHNWYRGNFSLLPSPIVPFSTHRAPTAPQHTSCRLNSPSHHPLPWGIINQSLTPAAALPALMDDDRLQTASILKNNPFGPAATPVSDPGYMSRKIRKFRTDKFDT